MNTYKYFFKSDSKKEAVGKINADGLYEAMKKASYKLPIKTKFVSKMEV